MTLLHALVVCYMNQVCHWEYESTEGVHLPQQLVSSSCCLSQESGLSLWVGEQLKMFTYLDRWDMGFLSLWVGAQLKVFTYLDKWDMAFLPLSVGEQLKVFTDLDRWCIHPVVTGVRPVM